MSDGPNESKENIAEIDESSSHSRLLLAQLAQLRKDSLLCDVTLLVQGERINAHRNVLAACSDYFKAIFTNDMAEKHLREMEMVDVEASTLDALVNFCYSGKITITEDNSLSMLAAACQFQLSKVQGICCEFLKKNLGLSNCLEIHATADAYSCQELFLCADMYIVQNFQKVAENETFNQIPFDRFVKLISSEELNVQSEGEVCRPG